MELQFIQLAMEYISDHVYILVPVLFFIGFLFKQTPRIADWLIPYLLTIIGVAFACGIAGYSVDSILQGILVAAVTVFIHQLLKQADQQINFREFIRKLFN